jgi:indole-3-glycerol phosphate synthase|tara:strand:+ start:985 stop:1743 length:759 start_codon:yes stop_codon:yes gene_type:complete
MSILEEILSYKKQNVINDVLIDETKVFNTLSLKDALSKEGMSLIAEIKMKSPSEGVILKNADPVQIAKDYESAGADAISVLTDQKYFGGNIDILSSVKDSVSIPVILKDFVINHSQIYQGANAGADAFLLITEALNSTQLENFIGIAKKINLDVLVELHSEQNTKIIRDLCPSIVGVNCRDLTTMNTNINYFLKMFDKLPKKSVKVAESGIRKSDHLKFIGDIGYDAALVGTSLMKTGNPGKALEKLKRGSL